MDENGDEWDDIGNVSGRNIIQLLNHNEHQISAVQWCRICIRLREKKITSS